MINNVSWLTYNLITSGKLNAMVADGINDGDNIHPQYLGNQYVVSSRFTLHIRTGDETKNKFVTDNIDVVAEPVLFDDAFSGGASIIHSCGVRLISKTETDGTLDGLALAIGAGGVDHGDVTLYIFATGASIDIRLELEFNVMGLKYA